MVWSCGSYLTTVVAYVYFKRRLVRCCIILSILSVGLLVEAYITTWTTSTERSPSDSENAPGILMTPILSLHHRITRSLQLYIILCGFIFFVPLIIFSFNLCCSRITSKARPSYDTFYTLWKRVLSFSLNKIIINEYIAFTVQ